ncbi:hypothetical protein [Mycolicibacterium chitae]|uniref:hypothetical protein n=1 Tax=Mycolicibacterium chitae TaxID=1792 RepID=UPI0013D28B77|nr:hypothetical protein [Mycolicibacterium chitae]MCV7107476.1 hypothetical protein [Mycolicibacterium chitae]
MSSRNVLMLTGLGALLAIVVLFAGMTAQPGADPALPAAVAAPTTTTTTTTTTSASPTTSAAGTDTDDLGFIGSKARCEAGQSAVALGRTQRSIVVVCADSSGDYEYRGVRINDGAMLTTQAQSTGDGTFVANSEGSRYTVSPDELAVTSGGKLIYRDTWAFYEAPSFSAESADTTGTATATATVTATPTVTPTTTSSTPTR